VLVDVASLAVLGVTPVFNRVTVDTAAPAALGNALAQRFPEVRVEVRSAVRNQALEIFDRTFAITQALTVLALIVAAVGTYSALTALRLQQASSTRLLQAQGVVAAELRRIALIRAATMGGAAVLLALPLGIAMAWVLCAVINPRSFGWTVALQMPLTGWLPPLLLGLAAALLAGLLPAPREGGALEEAA
jgi:putative ABC transport system permease protein